MELEVIFLILISFVISFLFIYYLRRRFSKNGYTKSLHSEVTYLDGGTKEKILMAQKKKGNGFVILCDSEEALRRYYSKIVKSINLKCLSVEKGYDVYSELCTTKCKLLIIDTMLAGPIDGLQVIKTIREFLGLEIPIIVLTNLVSDSIVKEAYAVGADNYLVKTDIEEEDLIKAIKKELRIIRF